MKRVAGLRLALMLLGVLALLALAALGASVLLDRPAQVVSAAITVEAPRREVWDVLTDFEAYDDWNPVVTSASGQAREGSGLRLEVVLPGHEAESLDPTVLIVRRGRKLTWQDRLVLPGVRDWEYEFVLQPIEPGRVLVVQELRIEGLLAPFADADAAREALDLSGAALKDRLDASG